MWLPSAFAAYDVGWLQCNLPETVTAAHWETPNPGTHMVTDTGNGLFFTK